MSSSPATDARQTQLRLAKRAQRERQASAGLVHCQVTVPERLGAMLRASVRDPMTRARLQEWLALEVVEVAAWPQLALLCWSRHDAWISGADALAIYERNWRHVDTQQLSKGEAAFINQLTERHGQGVFLG